MIHSRRPGPSTARGVVASACVLGLLALAGCSGDDLTIESHDLSAADRDACKALVADLPGVLALAAFVVVQRRRAAVRRPVLVDLGLLRLPTFRAGIVAALIVAFGEFGLLFTLPLLLQGTLGYSALGTGGVILCLLLGNEHLFENLQCALSLRLCDGEEFFPCFGGQRHSA